MNHWAHEPMPVFALCAHFGQDVRAPSDVIRVTSLLKFPLFMTNR